MPSLASLLFSILRECLPLLRKDGKAETPQDQHPLAAPAQHHTPAAQQHQHDVPAQQPVLAHQAPQPHPPATAAELSELISYMWRSDQDILLPGRDYEVDVQGGKSVGAPQDAAARPLFQRIDLGKLRSIPVYSAFLELLDNYVADAGVAEMVTQQELAEERLFVGIVAKSPLGEMARAFAVRQGWWPGGQGGRQDTEAWAKYLHALWFSLYRRVRDGDSSAFEHVFVGEIRGDSVIGMHNWLSLHAAEQKGELDYRGFIWPRRRSSKQTPTNHSHLLKLQFTFRGKLKPMTTTLLGASPAFEMLVYTLAFLSGQESVPCVINDTDARVIVHRNNVCGKQVIGSAYLDIIE